MRELQGPCFSYCACDFKTAILARISFVYLIACLVYLAASRNMETPFKDSLTSAQLLIKKESTAQRTKLFSVGVLVGIVVVAALPIFRPLAKS